MEITIRLYSDPALVTAINSVIAVISAVVGVKVLTVVWQHLPYRLG